MNKKHNVYIVFPSSKYKRTRKRSEKRGLNMDLLDWCINQLANDIPLPPNWKDHQLKGNMKNLRECHINGSGDWLLVYEKRETDLILYLVGTGSHSDLLGL